jgi:hypothetical protein
MLSFKQNTKICVKICYGSINHTNILKLIYRTGDLIRSITDLNSDVRRQLVSGAASVFFFTVPMGLARVS